MTPETILVCDPHGDTAEMYSVGLSMAGFRTIVTGDGVHALDAVRLQPPSAVVADVGNRPSEGWDLVHALRTNPSTHGIPVVVMTAWIDASMEVRAAQLGCVALMRKPCLPDALAAVLHHSLHPLAECDSARGRLGGGGA